MVANLNWRKRRQVQMLPRRARCFGQRALRHHPADPRKPYDVREIIARIVDGSEFDEFKARYGTTLGHRLRAHRRACRSASSPTTASLFSEKAR